MPRPTHAVTRAAKKTLKAPAAPRSHKRPFMKATPHKRRFRPGVAALREIRHFQQGGDLLIPRKRFALLFREVLEGAKIGTEFRIQKVAFEALQEAAEAHLIGYFEDAYVWSLSRFETLFLSVSC